MGVTATGKGELIRIIRPLLKRFGHEPDFMKQIANELTVQGVGTMKGLEWTPQNLWKFVRLNEAKFRELDVEERGNAIHGIQIPEQDFVPVPAGQIVQVLALLTDWLKEWPELLDRSAEDDVILPVRIPKGMAEELSRKVRKWERRTFNKLIVDLLGNWLAFRDAGDEETNPESLMGDEPDGRD